MTGILNVKPATGEAQVRATNTATNKSVYLYSRDDGVVGVYNSAGAVLISMNNDKTLYLGGSTYSIFNNGKFVNALGAVVNEDNGDTNTSIPSGAWKTKRTLTLSQGIYVIQLYAEWASVKGYSRQIGLSTSNNGNPMGYRFKDVRTILGQTSSCWQSVTFPLYVSSQTTYYVVVYHNSDSACNCITRTAYFKLPYA